MKKRAVKESEAFPELYGLTKRPKYTREIHMLRIGRMIEEAEQQAQEDYDAGYNYSPWEYLCKRCPACMDFRTDMDFRTEESSVDNMWNNTVCEICTICREFVGTELSQHCASIPLAMGQFGIRELPGPCPCHELSPRDAYYKTKEVL